MFTAGQTYTVTGVVTDQRGNETVIALTFIVAEEDAALDE